MTTLPPDAPTDARSEPEGAAVSALALDLPAWVERLEAGVWVSGPDRRIVHVNDRARELLGRSHDACIGQQCHDLVSATEETGRSFCRARCPLVEAAEHGDALRPVTVRVVVEDAERWLQLVVIPLELPGRDGTWLVHCATDIGRAKRAEAYLEQVAARSGADASAETAPLTPREREVLALLAGGATPEHVAHELHVSLVTVRNHVQRTLTKLGAHSIPEAVARYLLDPPPAD